MEIGREVTTVPAVPNLWTERPVVRGGELVCACFAPGDFVTLEDIKLAKGIAARAAAED